MTLTKRCDLDAKNFASVIDRTPARQKIKNRRHELLLSNPAVSSSNVGLALPAAYPPDLPVWHPIVVRITESVHVPMQFCNHIAASWCFSFIWKLNVQLLSAFGM